MANVSQRELSAVSSVGAKVPVEAGKGVKLGVGTFFFILANADAWLEGFHLAWDNALTGTITFESSSLPRYLNDGDAETADVTDISTNKGEWIQQNPATAYIPVTSTDGTTGGATVAAATITVAGGTAGGALYEIAGIASKRTRIKVVTTVGGYLRCAPHRKS